MKKRILFLMSDTGGGHRAAAQAIADAIHYLYPDQYDTFVEDLWKEHTPWPINKLPNTYAWLTGPGLPVWKFLWASSTRVKSHKVVFPSVTPILKRKIIRYLTDIKPDIVVSVHPLMNHVGVSCLGKAKLDIPFVTVVTDMVTIHPCWICPKVTRCFMSTDSARDFAITLGMPPEKISVCGQPVGLKFALMTTQKEELHQTLGLAADRKMIMVIGGGEGHGRVYDIARMLAQNVNSAQLVIVAGRNQTLKAQLEAVDWEIPTQIFGFVNNMPELMGAADILITKAGPGTISEAFIAGLPPLISGYIHGQELGNVHYVQQHEAGAYAETPDEITQTVQDWLDPNNDILQQMTHNAASLARPQASLAVAAQVCALI